MNWEVFFQVWRAVGLLAVPIGLVCGLAYLCMWTERRFGFWAAHAVMAAGAVLGLSLGLGLLLLPPRTPTKSRASLKAARSEARRGRKECVRSCRSRWAPYN